MHIHMTIGTGCNGSSSATPLMHQPLIVDLLIYRCCQSCTITILDATIDGVWSSWSAWSKCADLPSRCSHRRRFRTCTNPPPKHGGKFCTGRAIQIDKCNGNYSCATTTLINQTTTRRPLLASIEQCACGCRLVHDEVEL